MRKKTIRQMVLMGIVLLILTGCGVNVQKEEGTKAVSKEQKAQTAENDIRKETGQKATADEQKDEDTMTKEENVIEWNQTETVDSIGKKENAVSYSVWNAYWNLDGAQMQIEELAEKIQNINYFAAYFDKDDKVFIPRDTAEFYDKTKETYRKRGWQLYLTIVNDQVLADGSSSLKSTELLYRLFACESAYQEHAEELLTLALQNGYDGLEIDYENLRKDEKLWELFMPFVSYLYDRCREEGLQLRVVLEPGIEAEKIAWVDGPSYVVMCYNLYGSHSGPGPKADRTFLAEIMQKMQHVPGKVDYALANGGFDWCEDGTVTGLTTAKAEQLLLDTQAMAERDESSGARYFSYVDTEGKTHQVWYGDQETLETWVAWLTEDRNKQFSIWRVGE